MPGDDLRVRAQLGVLWGGGCERACCGVGMG